MHIAAIAEMDQSGKGRKKRQQPRGRLEDRVGEPKQSTMVEATHRVSRKQTEKPVPNRKASQAAKVHRMNWRAIDKWRTSPNRARALISGPDRLRRSRHHRHARSNVSNDRGRWNKK